MHRIDLVNKFLADFETAVANNNPESVFAYFDQEIRAYGTVNEVLIGFKELRGKQ